VERDRRARADLASAPAIDYAVNADLAVLDQGPGLPAVIDDTSQLQQLTEPDHLVADGNIDVVAHAVSVTDVVTEGAEGGPSASARGREAGHAGIRCLTFVGGHCTPHPVRLTDRQRVLTAALHDRTTNTHGLGRAVPVAARWTPLAIGVEEDVRTLVTAGAIELPFPQIGNRSGQAGYFGQRFPP
jgi:hypothetical protein